MYRGTGTRNLSPRLNTTYDFCIIDNPPAINVVVANSLAASNNHHLLVCRAFALNGLMELSATLDDVQQFMNPSLIVDGILITIFSHRTIIGQHIKEQLSRIAQVMNIRVYNSVIRHYPTTNAAIDYGYFIDEFLGGNFHG